MLPGCCLIYFYFLWAIHPIRPVLLRVRDLTFYGKLKLQTFLNVFTKAIGYPVYTLHTYSGSTPGKS